MVRFFYFAGRRRQTEGLDFDFDGNEVPAAEGWEAKRHDDEKGVILTRILVFGTDVVKMKIEI